jgi:hypothetical protein
MDYSTYPWQLDQHLKCLSFLSKNVSCLLLCLEPVNKQSNNDPLIKVCSLILLLNIDAINCELYVQYSVWEVATNELKHI